MICFVCGKEVECPEVHNHPSVEKTCKQKKGAIWVHVVDDQWGNIEGASVAFADEDKDGDTGKNGFAKFDPMDAGEHTATLDLGDLAQKYDPPEHTQIKTTLSDGQINYVLFKAVRKAKLAVKVFAQKGGNKTFDGAQVTITPARKGSQDEKPTSGGGIADFGVKSADDYQISAVLGEGDQKTHYCPDTPLRFTLLPGADETFDYEVSPLARPRVKVVESASGAVVEKVEVKLKKGSDEHDLGESAATTGLAALPPDGKGLRGGEYDVLLKFDENVYMAAEDAPKHTFEDGAEDEKVVELVKLARPKLRVVEKTSGKEIEGIVVSLTATKTGKKNDLDKTRNSGYTEIASGKPGLPPDKYTIAVAADTYRPVLDSPADVTFVEDDTRTVIIKVTVPKGAVRFLINRYDGADMADRVTFKLTEKGGSGYTTTKQTAARERDEQREGNRTVKVKEDWKEIGDLDPGDYEVEIQNLKTDVLDKQVVSQTWQIGPSATGKVEVKVEPGKTTEVRFTVHKYKKALFIGYGIMPGYKKMETCPTCAAMFPAGTGTCTTVGPCFGTALSPKRCYKCRTLYAGSANKCSTCTGTAKNFGPYYHCFTCSVRGSAPGNCSGCTAPFSVFYPYVCGNWQCNNVEWATVDTGPTKVCPVPCKLPLDDEQAYLGLPDNKEDLLARCLLVKEAIKTAYAKETAQDPEVLKIFMGPEFFFRGKDGAYEAADLHLIMDALREETKDGNYKDWLFVHGTAIGYLPQAPSTDTQYALRIAEDSTTNVIKVTHGANGKDRVDACEKVPQENATLPTVAQWKIDVGGQKIIQSLTRLDASTFQITLPSNVNVSKDDPCTLLEPIAMEILNYALVQRGGPDNVAGLREDIVYKEKISPIDFLRDKRKDWEKAEERSISLAGTVALALPTEGGDEKLARRKNPISGEATTTGLGGGSVFMMDGITFGLEVCLDHAKERLKSYYATNPKGVGKTQIHLIPSWGMSITDTSLTGMTGTLVFNVDGPDGSDAAKVTSPGSCSKLATPTSYTVPQPSPENVTYKDSSPKPPTQSQAPQDKTVNNLDPDYRLLVPKHFHRVNRGTPGTTEDYAWVDLYTAEDIPAAETV